MLQQLPGSPRTKTQKGLVSRDTSPFVFTTRIRSASLPPDKFWWSWRRELNPRPSDYKSDALPAELRQHCSNRTRIADWTHFLQYGDLRFPCKRRANSVEMSDNLFQLLNRANYLQNKYLYAGKFKNDHKLSTDFPGCSGILGYLPRIVAVKGLPDAKMKPGAASAQL